MSTIYNRLKEIQENFPQLSFRNEGYEYLKPEVKQSHKAQIDEITEILKTCSDRFVRFDNFYPRRKGGFAIRCQWLYNEAFTGVVYLNEDDFEDFNN